MKVENSWEALCAFIEANRERPLQWGTWDCCQFVAGAVQVTTGVNFAEGFDRYDSEEGAQRILAQYGSLELLLGAAFGPSKPVARAHRGDVLAIDGGAGLAAGICLGVYCAIVGVERLQFLRTYKAVAAWTIE